MHPDILKNDDLVGTKSGEYELPMNVLAQVLIARFKQYVKRSTDYEMWVSSLFDELDIPLSDATMLKILKYIQNMLEGNQ